jgi:hypothetical protein
VKASVGERHHHLSPAVGQLRKAVQEEDAGPRASVEPGFQDVNPDAVDVVHDPRTNPAREHVRAERRHIRGARLSCSRFRRQHRRRHECGEPLNQPAAAEGGTGNSHGEVIIRVRHRHLP